MRRAGVPADSDVTFAALFDACAGAGKRLRGRTARYSPRKVDAFDDASWDDWDDWGVPGRRPPSRRRARRSRGRSPSPKRTSAKRARPPTPPAPPAPPAPAPPRLPPKCRVWFHPAGGPVSAFGGGGRGGGGGEGGAGGFVFRVGADGRRRVHRVGERRGGRAAIFFPLGSRGRRGRSVYGGGPAAETARAIKALAEFRRDAEAKRRKKLFDGDPPLLEPARRHEPRRRVRRARRVRRHDGKVRNPPGGMGADAHAYTQALHSLALGGPPAAGNDDAGAGKKTNPAARGGEGGRETSRRGRRRRSRSPTRWSTRSGSGPRG